MCVKEWRRQWEELAVGGSPCGQAVVFIGVVGARAVAEYMLGVVFVQFVAVFATPDHLSVTHALAVP